MTLHTNRQSQSLTSTSSWAMYAPYAMQVVGVYLQVKHGMNKCHYSNVRHLGCTDSVAKPCSRRKTIFYCITKLHSSQKAVVA